MSTGLALIQQPQIIVESLPRDNPYRWLRHFDPAAAYRSVIDHIELLPGSRHERHTMRAYLGSLADFFRYAGAVVEHVAGTEDYRIDWHALRMPTRDLIVAYMAKCGRDGKKSSTITRYMASVHLFLNALETQSPTIESGADLFFVMEAQRQFRLAIAEKNPPSDTTSHRPALEQHGTRLTFGQVNRLFESFKPSLDRLDARRNLTLIYLAITSGLRAAELARVTLASIEPSTNCYALRVRGKRNNIDAIGIDHMAYDLIVSLVEAWNSRLGEDDPRRITRERPVFQPILRNGSIPHVSRRYNPDRGLTSRAIGGVVGRVTLPVLGAELHAHDMRRTCAALMRGEGFEWDQIRQQLRHSSIATTEKYVGRGQDLSASLLSNRLHFEVPLAPVQLSL